MQHRKAGFGQCRKLPASRCPGEDRSAGLHGNGYRWRSRNHLRRRNAPTLVTGVARRILSGGPADPNYTLFRFIGRTATL